MILVPLALGGVLLAGALLFPFGSLGPGGTRPADDAVQRPQSTVSQWEPGEATGFAGLGETLQAIRVPETPVVTQPVVTEEEGGNAGVPPPPVDWIYAGYVAIGEQTVAFLTIDGVSRSASVGELVTDSRGTELRVRVITPSRVVLAGNAGELELQLDAGDGEISPFVRVPEFTETGIGSVADITGLPQEVLERMTPEERERIIEQRRRAEERAREAARRRGQEERER